MFSPAKNPNVISACADSHALAGGYTRAKIAPTRLSQIVFESQGFFESDMVEIPFKVKAQAFLHDPSSQVNQFVLSVRVY